MTAVDPAPERTAPAQQSAASPAGWTGHVVVAGLHAEGLRAVQQLRAAGVAAVVVDARPDPGLLAALDGTGAGVVVGDPSRPEVLREAGLAGAVALLCVEDDDLATLSTALHARQVRTDLRVVAQLRNAAVGRALAGTGVAVLDVAELSAPAVLDACLGTAVHPLSVEGEQLVVVEVVVARGGVLRDLFGDLAPVAVVSAATGATVLSPGRDAVVAAGDAVHLAGPAAAVAALLPRERAAGPVFVGARAPRPERHRPASLVRSLAGSLDVRLRLALASLGLLGLLSVVVLLLG